MEYANIKEWLDKIIEAKEYLKSLEKFNSRIETYGPDIRIPIRYHIEEVADCMGIELKEETHDFGQYKYEYSFGYRGYKVFELRKRRLKSFAGTERK